MSEQKTQRQNIEQERGRAAWQDVISIKNNPSPSLKKEYAPWRGD